MDGEDDRMDCSEQPAPEQPPPRAAVADDRLEVDDESAQQVPPIEDLKAIFDEVMHELEELQYKGASDGRHIIVGIQQRHAEGLARLGPSYNLGLNEF